MIGSVVISQSPPGQSPFRDAQYHFERCIVLPSIESKGGNEMVRVQSSHPFDRSDKFWIILKHEPLLIDRSDWCVDYD